MSVNKYDSYLTLSFNGVSNKVDTVIVDHYGEIIFVSMIGYYTSINIMRKALMENRNYTVYINGEYHGFSSDRYDIKTKKNAETGYIHLIASLKDKYKQNGDSEYYTSYIYAKDDTDLEEEIYQRLVKYSSIPILREWMPYIKTILEDHRDLREMYTKQVNISGLQSLKCYTLTSGRASILRIVQEGLGNKRISIDGANEPSSILSNSIGLDRYLQIFGEGLAKKIQQSFKPKFVPGEDTYDNYLCNIDDYVYYNAGVNLYEAQRSTIQSIVNNMKVNTNTFLVGEMGSGKTLQSAAACYVHHANKNKGFNALIMCPSHLLNNWKNEIARFIPNSRSYVIHNLEELLSIKDRLLDPNKIENSFVILSKETAKIGYTNRPAVLFKRVAYYTADNGNKIKAHNVFVCPKCGKVLTKVINTPLYPGSSRKVKRTVPLELSDFAKENSINMECTNVYKVFNKDTEDYDKFTCGNKLWTANNKDDNSSDWVKLGKSGWHHKATIEILMKKYMDMSGNMTKKDAEFFATLCDQHNSIQRTGDVDMRYSGTKKYPIASYIKKRMQGVFDYGIFDEIQNYKGQTEQGHAFHILAQSCKKTINCTGTLMNGYVNSMYYLLYRLLPKTMKEEGFNYEDETEFNRLYGVSSTTTISGRGTNTRRNSKLLPGISSLVFTKFLLNNTVFISLEDMTEGLPNYTEIPYSVDMDETTARHYTSYESFIKRIVSGNQDNKKYLRQYCRRMLTLPDALHCMEDELNDQDQVLFAAPQVEEFTNNKDLALIDIVNAKVTAGEKVLVYYNDVGTTNLGDHIRLMINAYGFKAAELKASVKAEKREEYINNLVKAGTQVVICNPSLVETGLNLLDFTTIVFYQLGYNLNTMRQASRRSWRLSQKKDITVYFLYYKDTTQEATLSLMATKLHAAQSMEGKFSEEGLRAMSDNQDVLTQIASNVVDGIKNTVDQSLFKAAAHVKQNSNQVKVHIRKPDRIVVPMNDKGHRHNRSIFNRKPKSTIDNKTLELFR